MSDDVNISQEDIERIYTAWNSNGTDRFPLTFLAEGLRNQWQTDEDGEPLSQVDIEAQRQRIELERMLQDQERIERQRQEMEEALNNVREDNETSNISPEEYEFAQRISPSTNRRTRRNQASGTSEYITVDDRPVSQIRSNTSYEVVFLGGPKDGDFAKVHQPIIQTYIQPEIDVDQNTFDHAPREEKTLVIDENGEEKWIGWEETLEPKISHPQEFTYQVVKAPLSRNEFAYIAVPQDKADQVEGQDLANISVICGSEMRCYSEIKDKLRIHNINPHTNWYHAGSSNDATIRYETPNNEQEDNESSESFIDRMRSVWEQSFFER